MVGNKKDVVVISESEDECEVVSWKRNNSVLIIISDGEEQERHEKSEAISNVTSPTSNDGLNKTRKRKHESDTTEPRSPKRARNCNEVGEKDTRPTSNNWESVTNISSRTRSHISVDNNETATNASTSNIFWCPFCQGRDVPFNTRNLTISFPNHFLEVHLKKYYKCQQCNIGFNNLVETDKHYSFCGDSSHLLRCPFCPSNGTKITVANLAEHVGSAHVDVKRRRQPELLVCRARGCTGKFKNMLNNINHFLSIHEHENTVRWSHSCSLCGKQNLTFPSGVVHYVHDHKHVLTDKTNGVMEQLCGKDWCLQDDKGGQTSLQDNCSENKRTQNKVSSTNIASTITQCSQNKATHTSTKSSDSNCTTKKNTNTPKTSSTPKKNVTSSTAVASTSSQSSKNKAKHTSTKSSNTSSSKTTNTATPHNSPTSTAASNTHNLRPTRLHQQSSTSTEHKFVQHLSQFDHILFMDFDNWGRLFETPALVPDKVFVWMFCGGDFNGKRYAHSPNYKRLLAENRVYFHPRCGTKKNAADFALCVQAARLDLQLPTNIPFTVLSGDNDFGELANQLASSAREIHLINPHSKPLSFISSLLRSIADR